jgi:hypothetical protein
MSTTHHTCNSTAVPVAVMCECLSTQPRPTLLACRNPQREPTIPSVSTTTHHQSTKTPNDPAPPTSHPRASIWQLPIPAPRSEAYAKRQGLLLDYCTLLLYTYSGTCLCLCLCLYLLGLVPAARRPDRVSHRLLPICLPIPCFPHCVH